MYYILQFVINRLRPTLHRGVAQLSDQFPYALLRRRSLPGQSANRSIRCQHEGLNWKAERHKHLCGSRRERIGAEDGRHGSDDRHRQSYPFGVRALAANRSIIMSQRNYQRREKK